MQKRLASLCLTLTIVLALIPQMSTKSRAVTISNSLDGACEYEGHWYKLITNEMPWQEAEAYCVALGGHLVTITSERENTFVSSLINKSTMIGLSDFAEEGTWEWVTGEPLTYTNWSKNEPNNQSNEDYVLMQVKGTWNDGHLDREKWPFVCEWDSNSQQTTYTVEDIEQMVTDYFNVTYQDSINPGKYVVFHGETAVTDRKCNVVVRFQSTSASPDTPANVLAAYVSVEMDTGVMTIAGIDGNTEVPLFNTAGDDDKPEVNPETVQFLLTADNSTLSVRKNSKILLGASLFSNDDQVRDVSGITFQIEDPSVLEVSASFVKDNYLYISCYGLEEGTTNVLFSDSNSGAVAMIPVSVFNDSYLCYTLNSVPTQEIEKYPTNFYNVNGLYIDSYTYTVHDDKSVSVSFDVYNSNYTYGAVEVYDVSGNLKSAVLIDKMSSSMTSMREVLWNDVNYLIRDIIDGDLLSYRQESGFSKRTHVSVTVPANGYIKICNDPENSLIVGLINAADILLSLSSFTDEIEGYDTNRLDFTQKLTSKLVTEKVFAECVKDGSSVSKKLWANVGKEIISSPEALATFGDTLVKNITDLELERVIISTAADFGINVGEETFTYFAGPFGVALKGIFTIGKAENILVQLSHMTQSAGIGSIYIQNQGGGVLGSQQIIVESDYDFEPDTTLRVFSVTIDPELLSRIKETNLELYEAISNKSSYTYDISLLKNNNATQPANKVMVCIPIPEDWRVPMPNDLKECIYNGIFKIYRHEEDGSTTELSLDIKDGCFVFETNHFSLYTLVKYNTQATDGVPNSDKDNYDWIVLPGIALVIFSCSALLLFGRRKARKKGRSE